MTKLQSLLTQYRALSRSEREKGTYFELLIQCYLTHEPVYADLYSNVWTYADWARAEELNAQDTGIDLVARTRTGELHAVQCKLYAEEALRDQQPPVTKIDLHDLEASQIDWSRYQPTKTAKLKPKKTLRPHQESALRAVKAGRELAERNRPAGHHC